jgi:hypothetical protein
MAASVKFLIGLAAVLLMGWVHHGPMGGGEALIAKLEKQANSAVAAAGVPGVTVRLGHDPLSRVATLSGPANSFQREGMGEFPGLNDRIAAIDGIAGIRWADRPDNARVMPLLIETLGLIVVAYLLGFAIGWLLFGRAAKTGYL